MHCSVERDLLSIDLILVSSRKSPLIHVVHLIQLPNAPGGVGQISGEPGMRTRRVIGST